MKKYSETSIENNMRDLSEQELKKASGGCGPSACGGSDGHSFGFQGSSVNYQVVGVVHSIPGGSIPGGGIPGGSVPGGSIPGGFPHGDGDDGGFGYCHRRRHHHHCCC